MGRDVNPAAAASLKSPTAEASPADAPVINLGGSIGSENDGQNQNFTWDVSDFSGFDSLMVTISTHHFCRGAPSVTWAP